MNDLSNAFVKQEEAERGLWGESEGLDDLPMEPIVDGDMPITLMSQDGYEFILEKSIACMSPKIRQLLDERSTRAKPEEDGPLKLPDVPGKGLSKAVEYLRYHHLARGISDKEKRGWDQDFVRLDSPTLCELASASYHLGIRPLVDLTCRAIAKLMSGRSAEEIRQTFNIENDFTPEEEAEMPRGYYVSRGKVRAMKKKEKAQSTSPSPDVKAVVAKPAAPAVAALPATLQDKSVDELVSFIEKDTAKTKSKSKKKKKEKKQEGSTSPASTSQSQIRTPPTNSQISTRSVGIEQKQNHDRIPPSSSSSSSSSSASSSSSSSSFSPFASSSYSFASTTHQSSLQGDRSHSSNSASRKQVHTTSSSANRSHELVSMDSDAVFSEDQFDDDDEDVDGLDPELKAKLDREVEEFRLKLEAISRERTPRTKVALPPEALNNFSTLRRHQSGSEQTA